MPAESNAAVATFEARRGLLLRLHATALSKHQLDRRLTVAVERQRIQLAHPHPVLRIHEEALPAIHFQEPYQEPPHAHKVPRKVHGRPEAAQPVP